METIIEYWIQSKIQHGDIAQLALLAVVMGYLELQRRTRNMNGVTKDEMYRMTDAVKKDTKELSDNLARHEEGCIENNKEMIKRVTEFSGAVAGLKTAVDDSKNATRRLHDRIDRLNDREV